MQSVEATLGLARATRGRDVRYFVVRAGGFERFVGDANARYKLPCSVLPATCTWR